MNWLTKAFKKVFSEEIQDKEDVIDKKEIPTYKQSKIPFRFPLISDDEKERFINGEELMDFNKPDETEPQPLYMHRQWQQQRQNTIVHHSTKPGTPSAEESTSSAIKEIEPEVKQRTTKVPVSSKVFTPTHVPSPVHGFNRPKVTPIEELLAQKNLDEVAATTMVEIPEAKIVETSAVISTEPVVLEPTSTEIVSAITTEPVIMKQEPLLEQVEIQVPADVIEMAGSTSQTSDVPTSSQAFDTSVIEKKKKSLPFNVLMLNSDKEKYQQKKVPAPTFTKDYAPRSIVKQQEQSRPVEQTSVQSAPFAQSAPLEVEEPEGYVYPKETYLVPPEEKTQDYDWMQMQADRLIESLSYFQVKADIVQMVQGPAVTQFEITVGQGTKVSKIRNLADDLKLALAAKDIRIQAPIPGKSSIGIEIPNRVSRPVRISEVVGSSNFKDSDSPLEAALGLDLTGKPVTIDLRKMPHGLIAGATGSGKSVCINSLLISLLYKASPKELNLLLIDPKMVELAPFNHIPHLVSPVITDVKAATAALKWAVEEMERRYQLFAHTGVRDITRYNAMADEKRQFAQKLPYLLIVIDELADLMMMAPTEVEESICRIAQKARACGIHLVVATQRPSVDVITGLIKANIPTRIAFSVSSQIDSRTILDVQGAERLLGRGDMLYQGNGMSTPIRLQGTYVTDEEMEEIIDHARSQGEPSYLFEQEELVRRLEVAEDQDELFEEACRFILEQGSASTSLLQRKFHIGYNRAARLVDLMEQHGYVSEQRGSKAREVFITENDLILLFGE